MHVNKSKIGNLIPKTSNRKVCFKESHLNGNILTLSPPPPPKI